MAQVQNLAAIIAEDSSFVGASDAERASLDFLVASFSSMNDESATGSKALQQASARSDFVDLYSKLATSSDDTVVDGGVSFAAMNEWVTRCYSDNSQILQRIADKALAEKRAAQAAADAEKAAAKAAKAAAAAKAKEEAAAAAAQAQAQAQEAAP